MSDLSSWDSTEDEGEAVKIPNDPQFGLGMKHSAGMLDLSKVLSEDQNLSQQTVVPAVIEDRTGERIYDSVENLRTENQKSNIGRLQDNISTSLLTNDNRNTNSPQYEKISTSYLAI